MTVAGANSAAAAPTCAALVCACAEDIELLASLHDREPTAAVLAALRQYPLEMALGLVLASPEAGAALQAMRAAIDVLPAHADAATLDDLAAGYADVYLRYAYRASPSESVWLTEDGLERQGPMFALRALYRRHGLKAMDPSGRPEDHLVLQLRFAAHLLKKATHADDVAMVAHFLDQHLLRWIRRFASRLVHAGAPDLYTALALVTATYLDELRDHLTAITGIARPVIVEPDGNVPEALAVEDRPYVPGVAPSW